MNMTNFLLRNEELITLKGPAGEIEAAISNADQPNGKIAIVCHPHPLHGGTMFNKVVTTLVKSYQTLGLMTLRFNFRGVGKSTGFFSEGVGEVEDLLAVIDYAKDDLLKTSMFLAGFSFGAAVSMKASSMREITHLVSVAPPVLHVALENIHPLCPWVVIQGDQDEVVPAEKVYSFLQTRQIQPNIVRFPEAGHYFHGHLKELQLRLQQTLSDFINS